MAKKTIQGMTTYFVEREGGADQKVTVPSTWKVTFGHLNPGSKNHDSNNGKPALRFYESPTQQRMVITRVVSFRDMAIKVEERRVSSKRQTLYKDSEMNSKAVVVEANIEEWVDPDNPPKREDGESFFRLNAPRDLPVQTGSPRQSPPVAGDDLEGI